MNPSDTDDRIASAPLPTARTLRRRTGLVTQAWRFVVINQTPWRKKTPAFTGDLRTYRHMVVNHETGHWLGWKHRTCGGKGKRAPLMMQQSKGLKGCKPNPWPIKSERNPPRFR